MIDISIDTIILSYAIKNRKFLYELSKDISIEFFEKGYKTLYSMLIDGFNKTSEILSVNAIIDMGVEKQFKDENIAKLKGMYIKCQEHSKLLEESDFKYYLLKLKKRRVGKIAIEGAEKIKETFEASDTPNLSEALQELYKDSLQKITSVTSTKVYDEGTLGDDTKNMLEEYVAIKESPEPFVGVLTGLRSFDEITGGLHRSELTLIGGMEGSGKSLLMMNMAVNAWLGSNAEYLQTSELTRRIEQQDFTDDGNTVLYFSLEMPRSNKGTYTQSSYLNKRILSCISRLKISDIRKGQLLDSEFEHLQLVSRFVNKYEQTKKRFYVVDIPRGATTADIELKYLEVREKVGKIDLVVVDYLGIMSAASNDADHLVQGKVAADLHEFARTYEIPVLSAVQLNRPAGQTNSLTGQRYNTNRVSRSAGISQNANNVLIIETRDDEHEKEGMIIHLAKLRDGEKGKLILTKDFARMRVIDEVPTSEMADEFTDATEDFT
jgi:replicative DNA helicase